MSARQNKKQRKGRGNVHQRERTVTTLTEDPNTHYLVPTPSEEPGASHIPLPFNNPKMHNVQMGPSFQMGGNFQYGTYPPFNPMHPNVQQQQQQQQQQQPFFGPPHHQQLQSQSQTQPQPQPQPQSMKPTLPPGKNDLDILQNLKKIIKDGQHPFFRAIPQPAALASIYMGTISSQSQAQGRLGESPEDSAKGQSAATTIGVSGPALSNDTGGRQPPRMPQGKDRRASFASVSPGGDTSATIDSHSRPQPDSQDAPGSSQGPSVVPPQPQSQPSAPAAADADDIQSSRASSLPPTDVTNQSLGLVPSASDEGIVGGGRSDMSLEDNGPRPSLKDRLVPPRSAGKASFEHPGHYGDHPGPHSKKPKFYKDKGGGGASFDGPPRPGDRGLSGFGTPPGNGTPLPGSGGQAPPRSFHARTPPPDGRGAKPLSSAPNVAHRPPLRGPSLGRPIGREDRGNYRAEYDPRRPDVLDTSLAHYGDRPYRDFSPPLGEIPRGGGGGRGGRPAPFPPSPGRAPSGGDISGRRSVSGEWQYRQYPPSPGAPQSWDIEEGWDRPGDRFERDVPPRSAGWDYRGERDFVPRDGYSSGPPLDDHVYAPGPPNRDTDRGRPPGPYTPPYGRVRPRSPSPMRRSGPASMDDSRPPMKRPRDDYPASGYYPHVPPAGSRDGPMRRPPAEYPPPPPRSASSGPPPSSASSWPPPTSGGSGTGGPSGDRDRDYRMGREGMDFRPPSAGYDRPRSPGPLGRHSYGRGGGGSGYGRGDPRDRGGYGMPPRP